MTTQHDQASNKARAVSRGADLIAAYASDTRTGWAGPPPMTGADFLDSAGTALEDDAPTIIADAIADILHAAAFVGLDTDDLTERALNHYAGEQYGDMEAAWETVPASDIEYVPAIPSRGLVTVRAGIMSLLLDAAREHVEYRRNKADHEEHDPDGEYATRTWAITCAIEDGERA